MDSETLINIQNILNIVLGGFVVTILTVAGLAFGLWKQAKMFKADNRKANAEADKMDVEKELKQVELAEAFDRMAVRAANKATDAEKRLAAMESAHEDLEHKVSAQDALIKDQARTIKKQNETIQLQEKQIAMMLERTNKQDEEIAKLTCEVDHYRGIFGKMKIKGIVPPDIAGEIEDC